DSDIHQQIEECSVEVPEQQKQKMEDTMFDLVKICHHKQFLCIHDDIDNLIESALDSKLLSINSINSQRLDKKEQKSKMLRSSRLDVEIEHLSITSETESDEVTESNAKNLLPILSKYEVALEDKRECIVPISENFPDCDNHSEILFDSYNDDISVYDDDFEDIEYVEASLLDPEIVSIEEENGVEEENVVQREEEESDNSLLDNFLPEFKTFCDRSEETRSGNTTHANYSLPEYDSFCFEIEPDQERLINLVENDIPDNSSNDPLLKEANLFLSDNSIPPGIENVANDPEGDIRFLEELLINDSILSHESSDSNFEDNPLIPRPPPKPPDAETDVGEEITVVMNDKDKFDDDSQIFMFDKVFSLLSNENEDTIFDPGIFD
nr:hypothetical protein [Tanacetum cinerariifolium]